MKKINFIFLAAFSIMIACGGFANAGQKWQGVDESVVEKIAAEHGRTASQSFITGDLLLFCFIAAGTVGGFIAGYNWKKLMDGKSNAKGKDGTAV